MESRFVTIRVFDPRFLLSVSLRRLDAFPLGHFKSVSMYPTAQEAAIIAEAENMMKEAMARYDPSHDAFHGAVLLSSDPFFGP